MAVRDEQPHSGTIGLPYPVPSSAAASAVMRGNRRRDTKPELALRSALHRLGLRYRVDYPIAGSGPRPVRPDVVFRTQRVAVFVDGCFWHGCPEHGTTPESNAAYWLPKLRRNVARDRETEARLAAAGWVVLRVWEHDDVYDAASRVAVAVRGGQTSPQ